MARSRFVFLLAFPLLASCSDFVGPDLRMDDPAWVELDRACTARSPATSVPAAELEALGLPWDTISPDAEWARIARREPGGFGGFYQDPATPLTVVMVDPPARQALLTALAKRYPYFDFSRALVRRGRWDFAQLFEWQSYLHAHLLPDPDIFLSDIDEAENRLWFGLRDEAARTRLAERMRQLGVPCFLVAAEIVDEIVPFSR